MTNSIVFMGKPGLSGNYTHFKYLRDNCLGFRFFLVSLGNVGPVLIQDVDYVSLDSHLDRKRDEKELAQVFINYCNDHQINLIIPMNSGIVAGCLPFLRKAKVVQVVNTNTTRVYHYINSTLNYTSRVICICKRQQEVLKQQILAFEFEKKVLLIPHGVHPKPYKDKLITHMPLTIGYLGRLHREHKGIFKLPKILKRISFPFIFELVGEGKDQDRLMRRLKSANIPFVFRGTVAPDQINATVAHWDILLFPSLIEGFPLTLVEAMNNGIVPLANHLFGVTDYIIDSGKDGFLIKDNRTIEYAKRLEELDRNRHLLGEMKRAAKDTVRRRFQLSEIICRYQEVFRKAIEEKKSGGTKDFSEWQSFKDYKPTVLNKLKNRLKPLSELLSKPNDHDLILPSQSPRWWRRKRNGAAFSVLSSKRD